MQAEEELYSTDRTELFSPHGSFIFTYPTVLISNLRRALCSGRQHLIWVGITEAGFHCPTGVYTDVSSSLKNFPPHVCVGVCVCVHVCTLINARFGLLHPLTIIYTQPHKLRLGYRHKRVPSTHPVVVVRYAIISIKAKTV